MDPLSISHAARDTPDRPALVANSRTWTYADLADRVGAVRRRLDERITTPSARVALRATNRFETVVTLLALIEEGITIVPIHPKLTTAESDALVADAEPELFLGEQDLVDIATPGPSAAVPPTPDGRSILAMIYTSGTTGRPKGALLSRAAFMASAHGNTQSLGWKDGDRWLLCMPLCHVGGLSILTRCLIARQCVVLLPKFDAASVLKSIQRDRVTLLSVVPTMLSALLEMDSTNELSRLRAMLIGGAACPFPLLTECARRGIPALTTYGLTEACSQVSLQSLRDPKIAEPGSGTPLATTEVSIVDGRIFIAGPTLMTGYWRHSPLVQPFDTGDLGSFDEAGRLHVGARRADLIVTGGENVSPIEVESIIQEIPGVRDALVFGVTDDRWGQVVAAAIVGSPDAGLLRERLDQRLATHKRPRLIAFVDEIPLTSLGKPDRKEAPNRLREWLKPYATQAARETAS